MNRTSGMEANIKSRHPMNWNRGLHRHVVSSSSFRRAQEVVVVLVEVCQGQGRTRGSGQDTVGERSRRQGHITSRVIGIDGQWVVMWDGRTEWVDSGAGSDWG